MTDNIILIGFMGVGKGRTARALAALTGRFAVDTDDLIQSMVKTKIRHIFAQQGEARFRQLEQQTADWLEQRVSGTVVSTGGGFFKVDNLRRLGTVVYLHSSVKAIFEALQRHPNARKKIKKRPLLQNLEQAEKLFQERLPLYREVADVEISVQGKGTEESVKEILSLLNGFR